MPDPYECVLFDIGGVLVDTPTTHWQNIWCESLQLDRGEFDARLADTWRAGSLGQITLEQVHTRISTLMGLSAEQVEKFMEDLWAEYLGSPNQLLIDYFGGLKARLRTGIISNSFVGARERERERYDFESKCHDILYSHEQGIEKPAPSLYLLACSRLQVSPQRTIFVDDHDSMLRGARSVGITPIRFVGERDTIALIDSYIT